MKASRAWRLRWWLALWVGFWVLVLGEVGARLRVQFSRPYYAVMRVEQGVISYPWGDVYVDPQTGLPDHIPPRNDRKRRALYLGDSVTYGTGAGSDHRFTETLDQLVPDWHHINAGRPGWGGPEPQNTAQQIDRVRQFRVSKVVYLLNLNDLAPVDGLDNGGQLGMATGSYLLTHLAGVVYWARDLVAPQARPKAAEMHPRAYEQAYVLATTRIASFAQALQSQVGRELVVVLLPYEMQISSEAAAFYAASGVSWEEGFLEGSAQQMLIEQLPDLQVLDARQAFPPDRSVPVGEAFVHTAGGRLDFDHLTRNGHARLGHWLARELYE